MKKADRYGGERLEVLERAHHELDERLRELSRHTYLSPAEEQEVRELKKRKLAMKDRMADLKGSQAQ